MNIFVLDDNPTLAAQLQCDKHVVKMIVESAQMLSTAHRLLDGKLVEGVSKSGRKSKQWHLSDYRNDTLYKAVHMNHPCTVWTMESSANYVWHYIHFLSLCDEYTFRYRKIHATDKLLKDILCKIPRNIPKVGRTPFKLAMNASPECVVPNNPVASYRNFYKTKQSRFKMAWTSREIPEWFQAA